MPFQLNSQVNFGNGDPLLVTENATFFSFQARNPPGPRYFNDANPDIIQVDNGLSGYQLSR